MSAVSAMIKPMTIGITGPERQAPRQSGVVRLIVAAAVIVICLILLSLASDLLVDWLWFSSVGYPHVFWTTIGAKAAVLVAVSTRFPYTTLFQSSRPISGPAWIGPRSPC